MRMLFGPIGAIAVVLIARYCFWQLAAIADFEALKTWAIICGLIVLGGGALYALAAGLVFARSIDDQLISNESAAVDEASVPDETR